MTTLPALVPPARGPSLSSWAKKLYVQVLVAIAAGVALGVLRPSLGAEMQPLTLVFIRLIRAVVPLMIFATVVVGIAKVGDLRRVGGVALRALVYFELVSTLALVVGLAVGNLWRPGAGLHIDPASLDPQAVAGWVSGAKSLTATQFLMQMVPTNLVGAIAGGEIMPVLVIAVLAGFALCGIGERGRRLVGLVEDGMHALFGIVRIIMHLAPVAAFGAIAFTVGKYGIHSLAGLGSLVADVYLTSVLFVLVVFGGIARLCGLRLLPLLRYFKDELLIVFCATSGEAMIPRAIDKLERIGCSEEVVGLVLPTGFSFNMDGTAIYMTAAVLFIAQATGIHLGWQQQLTMLLVMLLTSKGAAGVTGGGFIALAATMPALGVLPVGGLALLLGVERFMSEIRAVTNLFGNIFATVVVARWTGALDLGRARQVLGGPAQPAVLVGYPDGPGANAAAAGQGWRRPLVAAGLAVPLVLTATWLYFSYKLPARAPQATAGEASTIHWRTGLDAAAATDAAAPPPPEAAQVWTTGDRLSTGDGAALAGNPVPPLPPATRAAPPRQPRTVWRTRELQVGPYLIRFRFAGLRLHDWYVAATDE